MYKLGGETGGGFRAASDTLFGIEICDNLSIVELVIRRSCLAALPQAIELTVVALSELNVFLLLLRAVSVQLAHLELARLDVPVDLLFVDVKWCGNSAFSTAARLGFAL